VAKFARALKCVGKTITAKCGTQFTIVGLKVVKKNEPGIVLVGGSNKENTLAFEVKPVGKAGKDFPLLPGESVNKKLFMAVPSRIEKIVSHA
jgi:hypothetical protein